ncbi:MAG TPA: hypothetical protein VJQ57_09495 [Acidimicrobiia bacterium]|nr:hypothetical protein [Acidimicrobiia bacterium]
MDADTDRLRDVARWIGATAESGDYSERMRLLLRADEGHVSAAADEIESLRVALSEARAELARCRAALDECRQSKAALNIEWQHQQRKLDAIQALCEFRYVFHSTGRKVDLASEVRKLLDGSARPVPAQPEPFIRCGEPLLHETHWWSPHPDEGQAEAWCDGNPIVGPVPAQPEETL